MKLLEIRRKLNYRSDQFVFILTRITSDMQMTPHLMKVKEESEKVGLKVNIQKRKIMASGLITSWEILAWRIPGTGKPGGLQSMQRVGHD